MSRTDAAHAPAPAADRTSRVHALFEEEIAAQEAMGLLAFHGFRTDGIGLRAAAGMRWRRLRPPRPSPARRHPLPALVGAGIGAGSGWGTLALAGLALTSLAAILLMAAGAVMGAVVGRRLAPLEPAEPPPSEVVVPVRGCVVSVRTLRADEARTVMERADGVLVEPVGPVEDGEVSAEGPPSGQ